MFRTALNDAHRSAGARMVDFGGWDMPLLYSGIIEEHRHTRTAACLFDVSHMGRLELSGAAAEAVLQRACTRNMAKLAVGRCGYSHVCNEQGGILDDIIVSRDAQRWIVVCNASNREKIVKHLTALMPPANPPAEPGAKLVDRTLETVMIAVQGPRAWDTLKGGLPIELPGDPSSLKRYAFASGSTFGVEYSIFRTGYTGEDGFELVVPAKIAPMVWNFLLGSGSRGGPEVKPAGLGARDTLRLEAAMPLYGHELGLDFDPLSAGCGWCVDLTKDFIGAAALRKIASDGPRRKLVGLTLEGRRIARQGAAVFDADAAVGAVTSGTQSPTLERSIAMAYVDAGKSVAGTMLSVDVGTGRVPVTIVPLPFYKRAS